MKLWEFTTVIWCILDALGNKYSAYSIVTRQGSESYLTEVSFLCVGFHANSFNIMLANSHCTANFTFFSHNISFKLPLQFSSLYLYSSYILQLSFLHKAIFPYLSLWWSLHSSRNESICCSLFDPVCLTLYPLYTTSNLRLLLSPVSVPSNLTNSSCFSGR